MSNQLVVFILDGKRYALHLSAVERVIGAVEVTPLPDAPDIVSGIINMQGRIIPVMNIRKRFRLPERELCPGDQMIIAHTSRQAVALVVDEASDVLEIARQKVIPAEAVLPSTRYLQGVVKLEDGMILIHDLDTFLSLEEGKILDRALKKMEKRKRGEEIEDRNL